MYRIALGNFFLFQGTIPGSIGGNSVSRKGKKQQKENRKAMRFITLIVIVLLVVMSINIVRVKTNISACNKKLEDCEQRKSEELKRKTELDEFEKYTGTLDYVEAVAREKLGMVLENEIVFKPNKKP